MTVVFLAVSEAFSLKFISSDILKKSHPHQSDYDHTEIQRFVNYFSTLMNETSIVLTITAK
ncbi:hypothetical protein PAJ34TS1_29850 [Paenibacillus azoreducens]|uniref:Uncharacterized protein n=1 Tax=Paenibacillus azoreducens TaxID=116718 RepID=A0A919YDB1_9BACL|nr:hypothetical protein J34TS1_18830 [Paenibacillus azoreducens]